MNKYTVFYEKYFVSYTGTCTGIGCVSHIEVKRISDIEKTLEKTLDGESFNILFVIDGHQKNVLDD